MTICTESKTDRSKFNLTNAIERIDNNETLSNDETEAFEALNQICKFKRDINYINRTTRNYADKLREININFLDRCLVTNAGTDTTTCHVKLKEVLTDEGICYSMNMLDYRDIYSSRIVKTLRYPKHDLRSNWTVFGYESNDPFLYPGRVLGSGRRAGITFFLSLNKSDIDNSCKGGVNGFRMTFHTPDEVPQPATKFYRIPFNTETSIAITPHGLSTDDNMKGYKPRKRQCYFPGEKRLKFFKSYNQLNCKLECFACKVFNIFLVHKVIFIFLLSLHLETMWLHKVFNAT